MNGLKCTCGIHGCHRELKILPGEMWGGAIVVIENENDLTGVNDVVASVNLSPLKVDELIEKLKPLGTNH